MRGVVRGGEGVDVRGGVVRGGEERCGELNGVVRRGERGGKGR